MQLDEGEKWTLHEARAANAARLVDRRTHRPHRRRAHGSQSHRHAGRIAQGAAAETDSFFLRGRAGDVVIATALAAKADCIVTGDRTFLAVGKYQGVRIVSVAVAVQLINAG